MGETILLATDGSDHAAAAAPLAFDLAELYDGSVHAVSVVETRTAYDNAIVEPDRVMGQLREDAESALSALEPRAADRDCPLETTVREGVPAEEILAMAEAVDATRIVMGARGKSTFKAVLLGSAAEAVLGRAAVPVVLVGEPGASNR